MLALFVWERLRYDIVSSLALLAAVATGCVPTGSAFSGFSNPVVVVIASILVVSRAIEVSGVMESAMRRLLRRANSPSSQIGLMTGAVTALSALMKNVGALALFLPIALQTASRSKRAPSLYLMPMAFGSLIGGAVTLIGTSPNLLISAVRTQLGGRPFSMFDFTPVGLPLALAAVAFLSFGWRLLPRDRSGQRTGENLFDVDSYTTELKLPASSPMVGKRVRDLEDFAEGELGVVAIVREEGRRRYVPAPDWMLLADDVLTVRASAAEAKRIADAQGFEFAAAKALAAPEKKSDDMETMEAVIMPGSILIGRSVRQVGLRRHYEVSLLAVSRAGRPIAARLQDHAFAAGDVIVLQGWGQTLPDVASRLGCLPLADRGLTLGRRGVRWIPLLTLAAALALVIAHLVVVQVAFFGAAVILIALRQITAKEAYESIEWPVIVMLGALLPIGEALRTTGASDLIARVLGDWAQSAPSWLALALVLTAAMLLSPLLHHAAAVLVMGPIAATIALRLGLRADPFLMAVALGASCDFLTPIGHQNNLLVMAPGGYRFGDYWRLGLPLSFLVVFGGTPLILFFWPLR